MCIWEGFTCEVQCYKTYYTRYIRISALGFVGPSKVASKGGAYYFVSIIDDRKVQVYCLKSKDQALNVFKTWKAIIENQTNRKIKKLRTNNGLEYYSSQIATLTQEIPRQKISDIYEEGFKVKALGQQLSSRLKGQTITLNFPKKVRETTNRERERERARRKELISALPNNIKRILSIIRFLKNLFIPT